MADPLLGRYEAAALLAVDAANGGELAGIEQVFEAFERLFNRRPSALQASGSFTLLCDAGLVEYLDSELGLTPHGRKLLRRAGLPESRERPRKVANLLSQLERADFAAEGSVPAPSESDVTEALSSLEADQSSGLAPRMGAEVAMPPIGSPIMGWAAGPVENRRAQRDNVFREPAESFPVAPTVPPRESDDNDDFAVGDVPDDRTAGARGEAPAYPDA